MENEEERNEVKESPVYFVTVILPEMNSLKTPVLFCVELTSYKLFQVGK